MLKKLAIGLVAALLLLLAFAATRPDTFRVERSTTIKAPAAKVFALLNDFHAFPAWSPWQHLDPTMSTTHSGTDKGVGAIYTWKGNSDVGEGRMEILKTVVDQQVTVQLDFIEPFAARNISEYTLVAQGDTTTLTWAMFGPNAYINKLMSVFVSMDSMIGKDFELGLRQLKAVAEKP
jgi:uncharacterized protein YndB with AHSA1/START domain